MRRISSRYIAQIHFGGLQAPEITKKEEESETAVFVISRIAGEGADRQAEGGDYFLTEEEHCRLEAVCRLYQNVVIIVNAGGQIDLSFLD